MSRQKDREQYLNSLNDSSIQTSGRTIAIWDLDYYFATNKVNCFNPDVMKLSSYHKQLYDKVFLITNEYDLKFNYDTLYIFKEKEDTPQPPLRYFLDNKVKWLGRANVSRNNFTIPTIVLKMRPDYLLYPEHNTMRERADQCRLFDNQGKPLDFIQDNINAFKKKNFLITDPSNVLWNLTSSEDLKKALDGLTKNKNLSFFEPINIKRLISDKLVRTSFLNLKFVRNAKITWTSINFNDDVFQAIDTIKEVKDKNPSAASGVLIINYKPNFQEQYNNIQSAMKDYELFKKIIIYAKENKVIIQFSIKEFNRFFTPYYQIFETIINWTIPVNKKNSFTKFSWLEWITNLCAGKDVDYINYWTHPEYWNIAFRDLLRQTWEDYDFLTLRWGDNKINLSDIPIYLWKKEFAIGL